MKTTIVGIVFALVFLAIGEATYDLGNYERIGCYSRVVNETQILFTDVNRTSNKWSRHSVNFYFWGYYLKGLVWRCAQKAKRKNLAYFGIQNTGECWAKSFPLQSVSSSPSSSPYSSSSAKCLNTRYNLCPSNPSRSDTCGGKSGSSFVYHNPDIYACSRTLDIVIGVDASASVTADKFNKVKDFLRTLVASFAISERASHFVIFYFDKEANSTVSSFSQAATRSRSGVNEQIDKLSFTQGSTVIAEAIREAHKHFNLEGVRKDDEVPRVAVFITDGDTHGGVSSLKEPVQELRSVSNARVVAFGVGPRNFIDTDALKVLTGDGSEHQILHFYDEDYGDELSKAVRLICTQ